MPARELDPPIRHWHCPACDTRDQTQKTEIHTQFHNCPANGGLGIPLVEVPSPDDTADARHIAQLGDKGVVTSIGTHHGSGRVDRTVFQ